MTTQFSALKAQFATMMNTSALLMNATIDGFKQATVTQCAAMTNLTQESLTTAKALSTVKTPMDGAKCIQEFMTKSMESSLATGKELTEIIKNTKAIFLTTNSATIKEAQESLVKSVNDLATLNPALAKVANASIAQLISTSNQAADTAGKVSVQLTETATKNIEAATKATLDNVKKMTQATATTTK